MYTYIIDEGMEEKELVFETRNDVFYPTGTSDLLIKACRSTISCPKKILDLGCGCGVTGIALARLGLSKGPIYASDISKEAVALAKQNANKMSLEYVARCGALFEPWRNEKFDIIVDDISGISDPIAGISSWYPPGVDCNAGRDGTKWITRVIEQSKEYLTEAGMLIFPVLSLSCEKKIFQALKNTYSSYALIIEKDWFLPDEITGKNNILTSLINDGSIRCKKKFGKWIWSTCIYRANN